MSYIINNGVVQFLLVFRVKAITLLIEIFEHTVVQPKS